MGERVTICEVSPRDGLQSEKAIVPTAEKIALVDRLSACGFRYIEAASFVSPRAVPQMADGAAVLAGIKRFEGVTYAALAPNLKGYEAARQAGADEVAVFAAASESFSRRNINCSIGESLARYREVCAAAARDGVPVRGYVSCIAACPYEGPVAPQGVADVTAALFEMGCREVSLGDTIGAASPGQMGGLLRMLTEHFPPERLAGHFHDTRGQALACIDVALANGLRVFDASVAGAGGCPFAPGAAGNVSTEAVCDLMARKGFETGIDGAVLGEASAYLRQLLGQVSP
jgi:hydroxymethylglutaryl-CoA lyase